MNKYKNILILGKDIFPPDEIINLYNQENYYLIGDGNTNMNELDFAILDGRLDKNTRIFIFGHGAIESDKHLIEDYGLTESLLKELCKYSKDPLYIHLYSCYGAAMADDVSVLPIDSVLVCHGEYGSVMSNSHSFISILANSSPVVQDPIIDFADNIFKGRNTQSIISKKVDNNNIFKFNVSLNEINKNPKILKSNKEILRYGNEIHSELLTKYNEIASNLNKVNIYDIEPQSEQEVEEWARDFFIYQITVANEDYLNSLEQNPHMFKDFINHKYSIDEGLNVLHRAALDGYGGFVQILLNAGTDVNIRSDNGATPLHCAAYNGSAEVIQILLNANAEPDAQNNKGLTPLNIALCEGNIKAAWTLYNQGADLNIINNIKCLGSVFLGYINGLPYEYD